MHEDLRLKEDTTHCRPYCFLVWWLVSDARRRRALAVDVDLGDRNIFREVEIVLAADIFVAEAPTFCELLAEIELFSSCVAQCPLLAWRDKSILFQRGQPFQ